MQFKHSDITIINGSEKVYKLNKIMLERSSYFAKMFDNFIESTKDVIRVDFDEKCWDRFVKEIYIFQDFNIYEDFDEDYIKFLEFLCVPNIRNIFNCKMIPQLKSYEVYEPYSHVKCKYHIDIPLNKLEYCMTDTELRSYVNVSHIIDRFIVKKNVNYGRDFEKYDQDKLSNMLIDHPLLSYFLLCKHNGMHSLNILSQQSIEKLSKNIPIALDLYFRDEIINMCENDKEFGYFNIFKYYDGKITEKIFTAILTNEFFCIPRINDLLMDDLFINKSSININHIIKYFINITKYYTSPDINYTENDPSAYYFYLDSLFDSKLLDKEYCKFIKNQFCNILKITSKPDGTKTSAYDYNIYEQLMKICE